MEKNIAAYEKEKNILMSLGNDLTKVREKDDLITILSSRLREMFYFNHAIVMMIDHPNGVYTPFLLDTTSPDIREHPEYAAFITRRFILNAPIINQVVNADGPISFLLEEIINIPRIPSFIKDSYECGVKEMLTAPLRSKMETIGFILIYSTRMGSFTPEFRSVLKGISPQLSSAVDNIIINEKIKHKEWVNEVLLSLSNDIVTVRDRKDLLQVINFGLKKLIDFTHNVMTILDKKGQTYKAFLTDPDSRPKNFSKYTEAITIPNPVQDGIYDVATLSDKPVIFEMNAFDLEKAPLWFRLNYAAGAKEMMIKILPGNEHSLILFSDRIGSFDEASLNIIERISSQLSTAASNISANEEKSFLLEFSHNIAAVRTTEDLGKAIHDSLKKLSVINAYFIRVISEDGYMTVPYMYDKEIFYKEDPEFKKLLATKISKRDGITARVMKANEPVLFDIDEEREQGNREPYISFWTKIGFHKVVGTRLRVGDVDLGVLWLLTDEINMNILNGMCAQISIAISNVMANEQVLTYKQILEVENDHLKEQIQTIYNFSEIIGSGAAMQKVYNLMSLVADANSTVLLLGETGTGKELIARAIHNASARKNKLMIKVNCAALPPNLIESELFGHEKGAFTGAIDRRIGKFELANNSTLFLDEIGEMPLELQVKLLRVIQERELERIGGRSTIKVDVRIITATNRNLEEEVKAGRFRSDLYFRLNVFPINLPPLRERLEDIAPLTNFFVERYSKNAGRKVTAIAPKVIQQLKTYLWPGNVRELEHQIERSILLTEGSVLREIHLPKNQHDYKTEISNRTLDEMERTYIIETLRRCGGKIAGAGGAADILDIPSTTLHSKMKKLSICKNDYFD